MNPEDTINNKNTDVFKRSPVFGLIGITNSKLRHYGQSLKCEGHKGGKGKLQEMKCS